MTFEDGLIAIDYFLREEDYDEALGQMISLNSILASNDLRRDSLCYYFNMLMSKKYQVDIYFRLIVRDDVGYFIFEIWHDIMEKISSQSAWVEKNCFNSLCTQYFQICTHVENYRSRDLQQIIAKKLKYYGEDTVVKFGQFEGKSFQEIYALNPRLIVGYFKNLSHFTLPFSFFLQKPVYKLFQNEYWDILEKLFIKIYVLDLQYNAIGSLNQYLREEKKDLDQFYKDAYEDVMGIDPDWWS